MTGSLALARGREAHPCRSLAPQARAPTPHRRLCARCMMQHLWHGGAQMSGLHSLTAALSARQWHSLAGTRLAKVTIESRTRCGFMRTPVSLYVAVHTILWRALSSRGDPFFLRMCTWPQWRKALQHGQSVCKQQDMVNRRPSQLQPSLGAMLTHVEPMTPYLLKRKLWDLSESWTSSRRHVLMYASSSGYMKDATTNGGLSPYARPAQTQVTVYHRAAASGRFQRTWAVSPCKPPHIDGDTIPVL